MERAKAYGAANGQVFTEALESKDDKSGEKAAAADPKKTLWVVVSGDRGMWFVVAASAPLIAPAVASTAACPSGRGASWPSTPRAS